MCSEKQYLAETSSFDLNRTVHVQQENENGTILAVTDASSARTSPNHDTASAMLDALRLAWSCLAEESLGRPDPEFLQLLKDCICTFWPSD